MIIVSAQVKLYAPWVQTLKEKRMVVKSLVAKIHNQFNVSVAETGEQDTHKTILLGVACVADSASFADAVVNRVISFIEENTEAEICDILREIR
ncbi:hypothetical protein SDC9_185823 [bioreactor metagenome]|uniref:DUF503 domain-containing protein n=1 Tax=bioreactor metagenome TaxID=1076179 RepID=A0A645HJC4_9ZZZZ